jgi:protein TonB
VVTCISNCVIHDDDYPIAAKKERRKGQVELIFDIEPSGKTSKVRILTRSKYNDLDRAAIKQVEKMKYTPSESGIEGERILIIFRLPEGFF